MIITERLRLAELRVGDAAVMAGVLGDASLHRFTGGQPLSAAELTARYTRLVAGSPDPGTAWLNWIVRLAADDTAIGTVQATTGPHEAHIAWIIGVPWQSRGYASEAAGALVGWLRDRGTQSVVAHIHPDHHASAAVALRAGLLPTAETADGEQVWRTQIPSFAS